MEQVEYTLPGWIIPIIVNDDYTGVSDAEEAVAKQFLAGVVEQYGSGHWSIPDEKDDEFSYNEVDHFLGESWVGTYCYTAKS